MEVDNHIQNEKAVLVIGGGLAGIRTALDLAESGRQVVLIDKAYAIGGIMVQLDRTFPTNNCDLCTIAPYLSESGREHHMTILPMTQVMAVEGEAGDFRVTLKTAPRYIDLTKCTGCGECAEKFPESVRFSPGLDPRAPTCMRYPQATPYAYSIDMEKCNDIDALKQVCQASAIIENDQEIIQDIDVAAIVLSTGADLFDYRVLDNYGGGKLPNVMSGLEYERIMSASGPTSGVLVRPSDGKVPKKIAWIQCVGSRGINQHDVPYCSSVCCMYAIKEAVVTKERFKDEIETVIFYIDMRTFGKDYENYVDRAKKTYDVQFIRSRPHSIVQDESTQNLLITYTTDENVKHEIAEFDMVILSTGFRTSTEMTALAEKLQIEVNTHNFIQTRGIKPLETTRPGIFVCGVSESPKDIPETMIQASAAACLAGNYLPAPNETNIKHDDYPIERNTAQEAPKIGVFICVCGLDIGGVIDVDKLVTYTKSLTGVVHAESVGHGCSKASMDRIVQSIQTHQLNRVVIGACSPRTHEAKFQETIRKAGINKYLLEIANLRDQDTWVHMNSPQEASSKAEALIRMAVEGVKQNRPLVEQTLPITKNVLVVGGGVTGMSAALKLADYGNKVFLIERSNQLGGLAKSIRKTIDGQDVQTHVNQLIDQVNLHEKIQVLTQTIVVDHSGLPGNFTTGIQTGRRMQYIKINHGATILATGALANRPSQFLLGQQKNVVTQLDLDQLIEDDVKQVESWQNIAMIQCVGSRNDENPNCSRVCCLSAIKNALRINEINPDAQIFILYRDIRTYGFYEDYYRKAREKGIIFVRYTLENPPVVAQENDTLSIQFFDAILGRHIKLMVDKLALSTGFIADDESTEDLAMIFRLARTSDHYFSEDHVKLRPADMSKPGFFIAGTAHAPKSIPESITNGYAAASRVQTVLAKEAINLGAQVAKVDGTKCAACLICVRACPYHVPYINADGYSEIDTTQCQGCGACAAECPAKAIQLLQYEDDQILAKLSGLFERVA